MVVSNMAQPTQKQIGRYRLSAYFNYLFVFLLSSIVLHLSDTQSDEHYNTGDSHEVPSLKYNREVNSQVQKVEDENRNSNKKISALQHRIKEPREHSDNKIVNMKENYGLWNDCHNDNTNNKNNSCDETDWQGTSNYPNGAKENSKQVFSSRQLFKALGAATLIRASPVLMLLFIHFKNVDQHKNAFKILLSFASGGLLGDAFLHLIPHALSLSPSSHSSEVLVHKRNHTQDDAHSVESHRYYMGVGLGILSGILVFLMVEKIVRFVKNNQSHEYDQSHVTLNITQSNLKNSSPRKKKRKTRHRNIKEEDKAHNRGTRDIKEEVKADKKGTNSKKSNGKEFENTVDKSEMYDKRRGKSGDEKTPSSETKENKAVTPAHDSHPKVTAYLNFAADFAHNFIDGLAIGASFLAGENLGIVTSIAIFLHEIPYDVRNFVILIQSGCSKGKIVLLQLTTALGAFLGTLFSLNMEGVDATAVWIVPFTAGGFIYISLVSVIPQLLKDSKMRQSIKEILAMLTGVSVMMLIALYK